MKKISIIIPAYREEKNISLVYMATKKIMSSIWEFYDYEIIFVNDWSSDNTWIEIIKLAKEDNKVKAINLSRNFGHQQALSAWYMEASWDLIISMDCDMQYPPILILKMIKEWEKWNEIVYAKRILRKDSFLKKYTAIIYYKILAKVSDTKIPRDVWDFRLIDKKVLEVFKTLKEKDRYIRGMFAWMWYKTSFVEFERPNREFWETWYSWKKMIKLAMDGILNFSTLPLKMWAIIWFIIILLATIFFVYISYDFFINGTDYPLYKWINVVVFGSIWLQFIFMWILWEYIWRIYNETRERPLYIISEKINFDKKVWRKKS